MGTKGGSAGSIGYDYQTWFVALKLVDVFFDKNIKVQPEAQFINEPVLDKNDLRKFSNIQRAIVDDVIVYKNDEPTYYNIKYISPALDKWKVSDLYHQGVLTQIIQQYKSGYKGKIIFVSKSPCNLFQNVFNRIRNSPNAEGIWVLLRSQKNEKEYEDFKKYSELTDSKILELSKIVEFEQGYNQKEYKDIISRSLRNEVTYDKGIANSLYQLAKEASNKNQIIEKADIINWFEKEGINFKSKLRDAEIIKSFKSISSTLTNLKNIFGNVFESHIERKETQKILEWIDKPLSNTGKQILLVVGSAGSGKTVILKDVIKKLQSKNVVTVALKSDIYSVSNFNELKTKLNINDDFEKLISTVAEKRKIILLIDQIDALSQALSSDRGPIEFYYNLINRLLFIPNLKIIVSCRTYDLSFDPILQQLDVKEKINVGNLSKEQIEFVITQIGLEISDLPTKLLDILGNAQNLNVFSSIYDSELKLNEIKTLQDLYSELWVRKITRYQSGTNDLIRVLSEISSNMYNSQNISVERNIYDDLYSAQLKFLISEGVLVFVNKKRFIQFFHQSFFDYTFSRTFVNSKRSIYKHISTIHQGLFVRSLIKQVLSYLRGTNSNEYLIQLESFLKSRKMRYHIKLMIINQLGFEEEVMDGEWLIAKKHILKNSSLARQFLESIRSCGWFYRLEKQGLVKKYVTEKNKELADSCKIMFFNLIEIEPDVILELMLGMPDFENKSTIISNLLFSLKDWSSPNSIKLFESIKNKYIEDYEFRFGNMLEKAMEHHIEWTIDIVNEYLNNRINDYVSEDGFNKSELFGYDLERVFEKLYKKYPELYFNISLPLIKKLAYKTKFNLEKKFFIDAAFLSYSSLGIHYPHWKLYDWLKEYVKNIALNNKPKFIDFFKSSEKDTSISVINLLVTGLLIDPKKYKAQIFKLLMKKHLLSDYSIDLSLSYSVQELIKATYGYFTQRQKEKFNKAIFSSKSEKANKNEDKKWKGSTIYQLLNSIPSEERNKFIDIQKRYLELKRKFGVLKREQPKKTRGSAVGAPLPQGAYEKMNFDQWLESFKEYDEKTDWGSHFQNKRGFHFGGLMEHSRMFKAMVKENPDRFFPFLMKCKGSSKNRLFINLIFC